MPAPTAAPRPPRRPCAHQHTRPARCRVSGIFGEKRSPRGICTCLTSYTSSGGVLNGNKRVNMVHVDDIVTATRACLAAPIPAERINVAGHNFLLSQLIAHCQHPSIPELPDTDMSSKCVCSERLLERVVPGHEFIAPLTSSDASKL